MKSICILAFLGTACFACLAQSDMAIVRGRVVTEILSRDVNDARIAEVRQKLGKDGRWPGIDYEDLSNTGFEHSVHLGNMVYMSLGYSKESSEYYRDPALLEAVSRSLGFWCDHDFICENWWHNQVGTPNSLVTILLLVGDFLDPGLVERTLEIAGRANLDAPGARPGGDRIKIGGIEAKAVLVTGNEERFREIMQVINDEIRFNTFQRGLQHDLSFHHRTDRVNNTVSYGLGYAASFAEWSVHVTGTTYAFREEKIRLLVDYYLDGICRQMVYGKYVDKGVKNRSIARRDRFGPRPATIPKRLLQATDYRSRELEEIIRLREGTADPTLSFCTFYWHSEHFACQRPGWYASVRMYSTRNRNMEVPYNSEGLKNHHKGDGANFLSLSGEEYVNIWPAYDWQKIPGATILQKPGLPPPSEVQKEGLTSFVGAVTDGLYGAACFDFISPHDLTRARKSWFFFDDMYVCLGAGIESRSGNPVATTLNQCLLGGEVTVRTTGQTTQLERGRHRLEQVRWIHHDGVGYLFPQTETVDLTNRTESGSWYEISKQWSTPRAPVQKEVFCAWIDHGQRPQGGGGGLDHSPTLKRDVTYQYVVVPGVSAEEMGRKFPMDSESESTGESSSIRAATVEILANTRHLQAVKHHGLGICQAVFYRGGTVRLTDRLQLTLDGPGAVMVTLEGDVIRSITVSDPSRKLDRMHLSHTLQGEPSSALRIDLPAGVYAGMSVTTEL